MDAEQHLAEFLRSSFRSVWSLETIVLIMNDAGRCWTKAELVAALRASDLVVEQSVRELIAAGLIVPESDGAVRYQPVSGDLHALMIDAKAFYTRSPSAVRRWIVGTRQASITAFSDAFKFRRGFMNAVAAPIIYLLCFMASGLCAVMLGLSYRRTRARLLLWSALCFVLLATNNLVLVLDLVLLPHVDLQVPRLLLSLAAISTLLYGFIWTAAED